jgi:hypothetical protein
MDHTERSAEACSFHYELARVVVAMLEGEQSPDAPPDIPEWFLRDVDRQILRRSWGAYALQQFATLNLSGEQRRFLKQLGKLDDIGPAFFHFISNDKAENGGKKQPIAVEILRAEQPAAMLVTKYHAFLGNDVHGPFPRSAKWKLQKRFDAILKEHPALFKVQNRLWTLQAAFQPLNRKPDPETLSKYAKQTIGELTPTIAKGTESQRADQLITKDKALHIAETIIRYAGPQSSSTLAELVTECWTYKPWHDEAATQSLDTLFTEPDSNSYYEDDESYQVSSQLGPDSSPAPQEESEELADTRRPVQGVEDTCMDDDFLRTLWSRFPPRYKAILACDEAVTGRSYTLQDLQQWTATHPGPWGLIKKTMGAIHRNQLISILREQFKDLPDCTTIEQAYTYFLEEARKLHQIPASSVPNEDTSKYE